MVQMWEVVGGADKGGIIVRAGEPTTSTMLLDRLSTGALIEELKMAGDRLHYKRRTGAGPDEGWVSVKLKDKNLAVRTDRTVDGESITGADAGTGTAVPSDWKPERIWCGIAADRWATFPKHGAGGRPTNMKEFKAVVNTSDVGEFWGIEFPYTPQMLKDMGPDWLTKAMHTAGTLSKDNAVTKFVSFDVKAEDVTKQDAENAKWGGAGLKVLLTVEYQKPSAELAEGMFIKMPHEFTGKNERFKNSVSSFGMDWNEVTFYNAFGGAHGELPFKSPRMYFCDMSRKTTNFINIVERIPYAKTGTMTVNASEYYPAPEKYRDWALPNNGVELYYAHARALAQFFGWHNVTRKSTDQVEQLFMDPARLAHVMGIYGSVESSGAYNSASRDSFLLNQLTSDSAMMAVASSMGFPPSTAKGFLDMGLEFLSATAVQAFPAELTNTQYIAKFRREAEEMSKYCGEMNFYMSAIPEFFCLAHPNAQVDNAFYWKDASGEVQAGLLDWGGIGHGNIPSCLGNGWMGAEPEVMEEHEPKLIQLFVDEYEKCTGFRFDCDDLHMCLKLAQASVLFGCMANVGMLLRIHKKEEWKTVTGRMDPRIDENFLCRCYFVQMHLWLKMWGLKNCPYNYFRKWMDRLKLPNK